MRKSKGTTHGPAHSHDDIVARAIADGPRPGDPILSIRQPYALMVVEQWKPIENRSKPCNHRGLLWIHASKALLPDDWRESAIQDCAIPPREVDAFDFAYGAIIGAVYMDGCYPRDLLPRNLSGNVHAVGEYCWTFSAADSLDKPIPYVGAVGIFRYNANSLR